MARRVEIFDITVPGGTLKTAPQVTPTRFDVGVVERIIVRAPEGVGGLVGWGIMHGGASVLPREDDRWARTSGEETNWEVEDQPDAGDWRVRIYNEGMYEHTLQFRFLVSEIPVRVLAATVVIPLAQPDQVAPAAVEPGFPEGVA